MEMFKNIWDALRNNPLVDESYEIMDKLHHQTQEMFLLSIQSLIDQEVDPEDIVKMDKEVNKNVQRVRKKVFEYFSLSTVPNIHGGLTLISLVIDYERIGDYAKDLAYMREEYEFDGEFTHEIKDLLGEMKDKVSLMFLEAHKSFEEMNQKYPTPVTKLEVELKEKYDELKHLLMDSSIKRKEVIVSLISARIIKRMAGHLDNIATSGARPFPKLGFKPGASSWED
jgi:phosphate uptake regulator